MLEGFKVIEPIQIRWCDIDALGHINNATYLSYLELARVFYWRKVFSKSSVKDINFVVAEINIKYKYPATLDSNLLIGIKVSEIRRSSFVFYYEIWEKVLEKLVVEANSVQVMYDFYEKKVVPIPEEWKEIVLAFERS